MNQYLLFEKVFEKDDLIKGELYSKTEDFIVQEISKKGFVCNIGDFKHNLTIPKSKEKNWIIFTLLKKMCEIWPIN